MPKSCDSSRTWAPYERQELSESAQLLDRLPNLSAAASTQLDAHLRKARFDRPGISASVTIPMSLGCVTVHLALHLGRCTLRGEGCSELLTPKAEARREREGRCEAHS